MFLEGVDRGMKKTKLKARLIAIFTVLSSLICWADQEAFPNSYVVAFGEWYAKCIPVASERFHEWFIKRVPAKDRNTSDFVNPDDRQWKGKTVLYAMSPDGKDRRVHTFDWFSSRTYIAAYKVFIGQGGGDMLRVRLGREVAKTYTDIFHPHEIMRV